MVSCQKSVSLSIYRTKQAEPYSTCSQFAFLLIPFTCRPKYFLYNLAWLRLYFQRLIGGELEKECPGRKIFEKVISGVCLLGTQDYFITKSFKYI